MKNNKINSELDVSCKIWDKEVYELVDYYNTNNTKTKFKVNSSGVLTRENKKVYFTPEENPVKSDTDLLIIKKDETNGKYSVDCGTWSKDINNLIDQDGAFIVYRGVSIKDNSDNYSSRYYKLSQGDIIKIGRIYFKILDIHANKNKERTGFKINGDESTFRGSMINGSNHNSIIINGQEIIRGTFKNGENKKFVEQCLSGRAKPMKNSFFKMENFKDDNSKLSEITVKYNVNKNPNTELFSLTKYPQKKEKIKEKKKSYQSQIPLKNDAQNNSSVKTTKICRICYGDDSTDENPLICPCICKGSMKYIHYDCLKNWLNSKIEEDISVDSDAAEIEVISYNRKDISCELCKERLPDYIKYNNKCYNISFYKPKFNEFIVLESMRADKHRAKFIHMISFDNKESVHIGRANECELSIAELSVSRFHCIIHKDDGELYLEDNTSKFGTLVLVQNNNLIIHNSLPLNLQICKTFIKIKVPKTEVCSFLCCKAPSVAEESKLNYQIQNKKGLDILSYFIIKNSDDNQEEKEDENKDNNEINKKKELIDEENKEENGEDNVVIMTEKDLIDNDKNEENIEIKIDDNKSINSENKLANSARIKKIIIKKDENDININNLSANVNKDIESCKINMNNGQAKTINLIKIKNPQQVDIAYDSTNPKQININDPNIYNPISDGNNINQLEGKKDD
jgi:hypothetical protein